MKTIAVIGAGGRLGLRVSRILAQQNDFRVVAIVRNNLKTPHPAMETRFADCLDHPALALALAGVDIVVSCVHARFAPMIVQAVPGTVDLIVLVGSTRCFTRFIDDPAREVLAAEALLKTISIPSVILHPTMIYGADGENNVQRFAALIRKFGIIPLPKAGRSLIQPIYLEDVALAMVRAVGLNWSIGSSLVIAGPQAVTYADFIRHIGNAMGCRVRILPVPAGLMYLIAYILRLLPGYPKVTSAEIQRLLEDKNFDIKPMEHLLNLFPRPLEQGLRQMFGNERC